MTKSATATTLQKDELSGIQKRIASLPLAAEILATAGGLIFLWQQWRYAHLLPSVLDEGLYLYKGLLFVSNQYSMYQFNGPWSNKMPLAFLIPGAVQYLFEPGLGTGRAFAVFLSACFLFGFWIISRRLGGRWWAALLVIMLALNASLIKMYSLAVSQILIACMLVWVLVLVVGDKRPTWQIASGSTLAGLMVLTRLNMVLVLPALLLYIYWQYGTRPALLSVTLSAITVIFIHALFWPGILQVYALTLPRSLTPFLSQFRTPQHIPGIWDPVITVENRLLSLFQTYRNHFFSLTAVSSASIFGFRRKAWKKEADFRSFVFLFSLFVILLLLHMWASLGQGYCVYCLTSYLAFFSFVGLLVLPLTYPLWQSKVPAWLQAAIVLLILISGIGIGFGAYEQVGPGLLEIELPRSLLEFSLKSSGSMPIQNYLRKTYGYDFKTSRRVVSAAVGLITSGLVLLVAVIVCKLFGRLAKATSSHSQVFPAYFGTAALLVFMAAGTVLTQAVDLIQERSSFFCNRDVIASNQAVGEHLGRVIPAGSKVYWKGGNSAVPLLYVPGIEIYPSQINGDYTFKNYGDPQTLVKYGYWSEELAEYWLDEADFILVQQGFFSDWYRERLKSRGYKELESSPPTVYCEENSHIRIFHRVQ